MSVIDKIRAKAAADVKHVVLAEGTEPRTVQAAEKIVKLGLAKITLVGAKAEIEAKAAELGVDLTGVSIADPATSEKTASYAEQLFHIREKKGMTLEKATELCLKNTLFYGTMMLKMGDADAMVAGAINTTGDVLRPALQIIKGAPGIKTVSSCFLMEVQDKKYGDDGVLVYFDDDRRVTYDEAMLQDLELAYAMTIHKSQGSEFPTVVLALLPGPPQMMVRNLLYTAVTRAKQRVVMVGSEGVLRRMVENDKTAHRYSALGERLQALDRLRAIGEGEP